MTKEIFRSSPSSASGAPESGGSRRQAVRTSGLVGALVASGFGLAACAGEKWFPPAPVASTPAARVQPVAPNGKAVEFVTAQKRSATVRATNYSPLTNTVFLTVMVEWGETYVVPVAVSDPRDPIDGALAGALIEGVPFMVSVRSDGATIDVRKSRGESPARQAARPGAAGKSLAGRIVDHRRQLASRD